MGLCGDEVVGGWGWCGVRLGEWRREVAEGGGEGNDMTRFRTLHKQ
jgi:hypothetical protein